MDFNIKNPGHIFAMILLSISFLILIGLSLSTYFLSITGVTQNSTDVEIPEMSGLFSIIFQIIMVALQLFLFIVFMILVPIIWYVIVNKLSFGEIKSRLKLDFKNFDKAVLWGFLTVFLIFAINGLINYLVGLIGYDSSQMSNVDDIERIFISPVSMFIVIAFQPIGEEIFFRGFLLDKINYLFNKNQTEDIDDEGFLRKYQVPAVFTTSLLFGFAHMSYGEPYVFLVTFVFGLLLGFAVVKTKSLYTSIIAHMLLNIVTFAVYFSFKDILGF